VRFAIYLPTFRKNVHLPPLGLKSTSSKTAAVSCDCCVCHLRLPGFFLGLLVDLEDGGTTILSKMYEILCYYIYVIYIFSPIHTTCLAHLILLDLIILIILGEEYKL
jgi:hypothetical protein